LSADGLHPLDRHEFDLTILLIEHQMRLVMGICERLKVLDFRATIAEGTRTDAEQPACWKPTWAKKWRCDVVNQDNIVSPSGPGYLLWKHPGGQGHFFRCI
jgi:energy-coupling factor transporter ATP-binding protein EcfA2